MIKEATGLAVRREVNVDVARERAFEVFTGAMETWFSHHLGDAPPVRIVVEPRAGGRWFERAADGTECDWGFVTEWEPPMRVLFAWHLSHEWKFDPDPARATAIEVLFHAEGPAATRVELEHRGFEVLGEHAREVADAVGSENGWNGLLQQFAQAVRT